MADINKAREQYVTALREERKDLISRLESIDTQLELMSKANGRPARRGRRTTGARSGRGQRGQQLLDLLGKAEGPMRPAEISKAMNVAPSYVSRLLKSSVESGAVKKSAKGYALK